MEVEWSLVDDTGAVAGYDATPLAFNIFKWTVKASEYVQYDKKDAILEGTVTIQNKDYTPVTISGENVTLTYDGDTLDVSKYFTIDKNAGTASYECLGTSTGSGKIHSTILTMETLGTFDIKVTTDKNDIYDKAEHIITLTVEKARPYVAKIEASEITYGESLKDSILHGKVQLQQGDDTIEIAGSFAWKEDGIKPAVKDGKEADATEYEVIFTPTDLAHYQVIGTKLTLTVHKADDTPNLPEETIFVSYLTKKVSEIELPKEWIWKSEDAENELKVGETNRATAVYIGEDKGNYKQETIEITITYAACEHETTMICDQKEADYIHDGYTGDTYCTICNEKIKSGNVIEKLQHSIGKDYKDDSKKYQLKVLLNNENEKTVAYKAPTDQTASTLTVPDTVTLDGVTYKVTMIEKNAFKGCKKLKKVLIGSNVTTIGENAFAGCTKLNSVAIGSKVNKIAKKAFYNCKNLKTLTIRTKKLNLNKVGSKAFGKTSVKLKVSVPKTKYKAYKTLLLKRGVSKKAKFQKK